jgi:hypothetical protein
MTSSPRLFSESGIATWHTPSVFDDDDLLDSDEFGEVVPPPEAEADSQWAGDTRDSVRNALRCNRVNIDSLVRVLEQLPVNSFTSWDIDK